MFGKKSTERSHRRGASIDKDWTKGPILGNLLRLSWPMVVMESLYVVSQIVDMIWVGKLGSAAIAGVGVANIVLLFVMSMDFGLIVGVRAMISRYVGAEDISGANYIAAQAFILAVVWGALITVAGIFLAGPVMGMVGVESRVVSEGVNYLGVMFAGWIAMEILVMGLYVIQASGDTLTPMMIELIIRTFHVSLCPLLVMGWWGFPALGVRGAAWSNVLSHILGSILVVLVLFGKRSRLGLALNNFRFDPQIMWRILKIGIPALIMSLQRSLGSLALMWFIIPFGTLALAAHSIAARVDMFLFMPGMGLGSGAGVLVGQNLGAGHPERAEKGGWLAVGIVQAFMMSAGLALLVWAEAVMGIITPDKDLIVLGSVFLRIATASYLVLGPATVLQSCIAGAGDAVPNMIISLAMVWVVQLPLAYLLPRVTSLGVLGVRWSIVASTFAGAFVYVVYFKLGKWKTRKI